jgi:hypothetical protein
MSSCKRCSIFSTVTITVVTDFSQLHVGRSVIISEFYGSAGSDTLMVETLFLASRIYHKRPN